MKVKDWSEAQARRFSGGRFNISSTRAQGRGMEDILSEVEDNMKTILDVGCCDGGVVLKLRELGYKAFGVDHPKVIERTVRTNVSEVEGLWLSADLEVENLGPLWHGRFDMVIATEVIEHLLHDFELLVKIHEWLKRGGKLYLTTRSGGSPEGHHVRHYTEVTIVRLMTYAGFESIEVKTEERAIRATGRKP